MKSRPAPPSSSRPRRSFEPTNLRSAFMKDQSLTLRRPDLPPSRYQAQNLLNLVQSGIGMTTLKAAVPEDQYDDRTILSSVLIEHAVEVIDNRYNLVTKSTSSLAGKSRGRPSSRGIVYKQTTVDSHDKQDEVRRMERVGARDKENCNNSVTSDMTADNLSLASGNYDDACRCVDDNDVITGLNELTANAAHINVDVDNSGDGGAGLAMAFHVPPPNQHSTNDDSNSIDNMNKTEPDKQGVLTTAFNTDLSRVSLPLQSDSYHLGIDAAINAAHDHRYQRVYTSNMEKYMQPLILGIHSQASPQKGHHTYTKSKRNRKVVKREVLDDSTEKNLDKPEMIMTPLLSLLSNLDDEGHEGLKQMVAASQLEHAFDGNGGINGSDDNNGSDDDESPLLHNNINLSDAFGHVPSPSLDPGVPLLGGEVGGLLGLERDVTDLLGEDVVIDDSSHGRCGGDKYEEPSTPMDVPWDGNDANDEDDHNSTFKVTSEGGHSKTSRNKMLSARSAAFVLTEQFIDRSIDPNPVTVESGSFGYGNKLLISKRPMTANSIDSSTTNASSVKLRRKFVAQTAIKVASSQDMPASPISSQSRGRPRSAGPALGMRAEHRQGWRPVGKGNLSLKQDLPKVNGRDGSPPRPMQGEGRQVSTAPPGQRERDLERKWSNAYKYRPGARSVSPIRSRLPGDANASTYNNNNNNNNDNDDGGNNKEEEEQGDADKIKVATPQTNAPSPNRTRAAGVQNYGGQLLGGSMHCVLIKLNRRKLERRRAENEQIAREKALRVQETQGEAWSGGRIGNGSHGGIAGDMGGEAIIRNKDDAEGYILNLMDAPRLYAPKDSQLKDEYGNIIKTSDNDSDWVDSEMLLDSLDGDDDTIPLRMTLLFKSITNSNDNTAAKHSTTPNQAGSGSMANPELATEIHYITSMHLLAILHKQLRCPQALHESFWKAHCKPTGGNIVAILLRLSILMEARDLLMALLRCLFLKANTNDKKMALEEVTIRKRKKRSGTTDKTRYRESDDHASSTNTQGAGRPASAPMGSDKRPSPLKRPATAGMNIKSSPSRSTQESGKTDIINMATMSVEALKIRNEASLAVSQQNTRIEKAQLSGMKGGRSGTDDNDSRKGSAAAELRPSVAVAMRRASSLAVRVGQLNKAHQLNDDQVLSLSLLDRYLDKVPWKVTSFMFCEIDYIDMLEKQECYEELQGRRVEMRLQLLELLAQSQCR